MYGYTLRQRRYGPTVRPRQAPRRQYSMDELNRRLGNLRLGGRECERRRGMSRRFRSATRQVTRGLRGAGQRIANRIQGDARVPGYQVIKALSTGGMSDAILQVKDPRSGTLYIAKRVSARGSYRERAEAELETLKRIVRGQNLNYMSDYIWEGTRLTLILEHCNSGNLSDFIKLKQQRRGSVSEEFIWRVTSAVATALAWLHSGIKKSSRDLQPVRGWDSIYHLDIKPHNVFISTGHRGAPSRITLGDFGLAVFESSIRSGKLRGSVGGTSSWIAPELEAGEYRNVSPAADVWQLGGLCQALGGLMSRPQRSTPSIRASAGRSYSSSLNRLVSAMSAHRAPDRPQTREIITYVRRAGY